MNNGFSIAFDDAIVMEEACGFTLDLTKGAAFFRGCTYGLFVGLI